MSDKMREALKASECLYAWALSPNSQPIEKIVEKFQIVRATLTRQPESRAHEREIQKLLERRDELETICDQLAARVAELTGIDIGEHSSANCPWTNALEAPDKPITDPLNEQPESEPVAWMCRHPNGRWDKPVRSKEYAETILKSWQEHNPHVHLVPLVPAGSVLPHPSAQVPDGWQAAAKVALEFARCPGATNYPQNCIAHIEGLAKLILSAAPSIAEKRECCCGETDDAWRLCPEHGPSPEPQEVQS